MKKIIFFLLMLFMVGTYFKTSEARNIIYKKVGSYYCNTDVYIATTTFHINWKLLEVNIHFADAVTDTLKLLRDSNESANYDTLLKSQTLTATTNFVYVSTLDGLNVFPKGDELSIRLNTTQDTTAYYTLIVEPCE